MENPGEIYRDNPFFPPDQDLSAVAFQRIAPYSEAFWHFHWNKDEKKVRKYTLPAIVSKTAAEWEKKERPATLQVFLGLNFNGNHSITLEPGAVCPIDTCHQAGPLRLDGPAWTHQQLANLKTEI